MDLLEAQVQNQVLCYLSAKKIYHWRQNTGSFKVNDRYIRSGMKGISDILGILPDGRFLAIEVKRSKGGRVSPEQQAFLQAIKDNNGIALVINSLDQLIDELNKIL